MTVIDKANELVEKEGKKKAIEYFENKIEELGETKNFLQLCKKSGYQTAIKYINEKH